MIRAFIFARGGSKGLPGKNIKSLCGKPLLAYAIESALKSKHIDSVTVSTDCPRICDKALEYGAHVIRRPWYLATDDAPEWLSWQHALIEVNAQADIFVSLPATTPFRAVYDIDRTIEAVMSGAEVALTITQAKPFMLHENMKPVFKATRRQDAKVFNIAGSCYSARAGFIMSNKSIWDGMVTGIEVPQERALDIDTEYDFRIAELLMGDNLRATQLSGEQVSNPQGTQDSQDNEKQALNLELQ